MARRARLLAIAGLIGMSAAPPLHAQPALAGPEILISTQSSEGYNSSLATSSAGSLVAWREGSNTHLLRIGWDGSTGTDRLLGSGYGARLIAADGGFFVSWVPSGTASFVFQRLDEEGSSLTEPLPVSTADRPIHDGVFLTADGKGGFVALWRQGHEILTRRFRSSGVPWRRPAVVYRVPDSSYEPRDLSAACAPDGACLAIWYERVNWDSPGRARGRLLGPTGEPTGEPLDLSTGWVSNTSALMALSSGGFALAWSGWETEEQLTPGLWLRFFDASGQPRSAPVRIASSDPYASVFLTADAVDRLLVGWKPSSGRFLSLVEVDDEGRRTSPEIVLPDVVKLGGAGDGDFLALSSWRTLTAQRLVAGHSPGVLRFAQNRSVVPEDAGELHLVVWRREGTTGRVSADLLVEERGARAGVDFISPATVSFEDGESRPQEIVVTVLPDDLAEADEGFRLHLTAPAGGAALGPPASVHVEIRDDDTPSPLLAQADAPRVIYTFDEDYSEWINTPPRVCSLREGSFVTVLNLLQHVVTIGDYPVLFAARVTPENVDSYPVPDDPASEAELAAHPAGGYTLTWAAYRRKYDDGVTWVEFVGAYAQRFDDAGSPRGEPATLPWAPSAMTSGRGGFVAVRTWRDRRPPYTTKIQVHRYSPTGRRLSSATASTSSDGTLGMPAVASAPSGQFVVVWRRSSPGSEGIYARLFGPDGSLHGPEIRVDVLHEGDQIFASVAMQKNGSFLVAWQSSPATDSLSDTPGEEKVWAQLFAPNGRRLGSFFALDPEEPLPQLSPVLSTTQEGRYSAVWYRRALSTHYGDILVGRSLGEHD